MTTLNTIIEEEKKKASKQSTYPANCMGGDVLELDRVKKLLSTAMQRAYEAGKADWLRSEIEKLEGTGEICGNCNGDGWVSGIEAGHGCNGTYESCARNCPIQIQTQEGCEVCQGDGRIRHTDVTSIITRYKEELKVLESK